MPRPSIADLEYLLYGGGADAKYAALQQFAADGVTLVDLLGATSGSGGVGGLVGAGSGATNYPQTTSKAAIEITGDIDIRVRASLPNWSGTDVLAAKEDVSSTQRCWTFVTLVSTTRPRFRWSTDGTFGGLVNADATASAPFANNETGWIRVTLDVDNGAGGYDVKFFTAADDTDDPTVWTQLGSTITGGAPTSIFAGTDPLRVGVATGGNVFGVATYRRMIVRDGIDGTVVADWRGDAPTLRYNDLLGNIFTITGTSYAWTA